MGFGRLLLSFFLKIRDIVQGWIIKGFEKLKDPKTGKLSGVNPSSIPKILMFTTLTFFVIIVLIKVFTSTREVSGGIDDFKKEFAPKDAINLRTEDRFSSQNDIVAALNQFDNPLQNLKTDSDSTNFLTSDLPLSASECLELIEKMKINAKLSDVETLKANQCLEENPMGLSAEDVQLAKKMIDPSISEAEKKFLADALAGKLSPEERAVALALAGDDAEKARQASEAIKSGNPELIAALGKQLNNEPLTDEEKQLLAGLGSGSGSGVSKDFGTSFNDSGSTSSGGGDAETILKTITQEVANREQDIKEKENELGRQQIQAANAADKISQGKDLTGNETRSLQNFTQSKQELEKLKAIQEERKKELAKRWVRMQKTLSESTATIGQILPSGVFIEYEGEEVNCKTVKPLPIKRKVKKKAEMRYVDIDNRPLRPEEVEYIKILKKKAGDGTLAKNDAANFLGDLGQPAGSMGDQQAVDIAQLFAFKDATLKQFEISPDTKIPAVLETQILVTDKGASQQIRIRVLDDIHDSENNNIVIPKGALALAMTSSGFDADNGIMNITIDKISFGGKTIATKMVVGSGDGQMGLRGEVRDTQWKYLAGAFITSFTGGALGYFSQQIIQPFQASTNAGQALTGSALAGSAEVLNRLAEIYSSKLQSAPKVFFVPANVPLVLFPQGN